MTVEDIETKYLRFTRVPDHSRKQKTRSYLIFGRHGDLLGRVKWFGRWRQYTFFPEPGTVWNNGCLHDVQAFIDTVMAEWRRGEHRQSDYPVTGV